MARTNVCKECGTTEGPWVGTNHNLCKGCADARPKPPSVSECVSRRGGATASLLGAAMLGAIIASAPKQKRGGRR